MTMVQELLRLSRTYFIDGVHKHSSSSQTFPAIDPAAGEQIGEVADCTDEEVDEVIAIANRAQRQWWADSALERAERLHEVAANLRRMRPDLAEILTREMGKPYKESADEVDWSATATDYYAEIGRHDLGHVVGPAVAGQTHFSVKEPMGVVVVVLPFNYPYVLLCWEAIAALSAGNAVIVKPSENTSLSTLKFMEAFESLPPGLIQCVTGGGRVGQRLVASSDTHMVAFTGSVATGQAIARTCAETFKPSLIEASGNDPFIVMPSAPMDAAVRGTAFAAFLNCGQVCTSAERIFVHTDIYDEFAERLVAEASRLRIGHGLERVDLGPMVSEKERNRYEGVLARATEQGARVAHGGGRPEDQTRGWFVEPTVLTEVTPDMDILNSESFGPVAPLCRVDSFDEAIERSNASDFGLGSNIYTSDLKEAIDAVHRLEAGMVWVNAPLLDNDAGPFGGRKLSGTGRQLGAEGLDTFRHTKFVMIDPGASHQDFWWFPYSDDESYTGE
jgi:acyl-CoA reductase-like NAD-dependent aldehyde dehydrogenase